MRLIPRYQLVQCHALASEDVERAPKGEVHPAVRKVCDSLQVRDVWDGRAVLRQSKTSGIAREEEPGNSCAPLAPPAYVVGIRTHCPNSAKGSAMSRARLSSTNWARTYSRQAVRRCLGTSLPRQLHARGIRCDQGRERGVKSLAFPPPRQEAHVPAVLAQEIQGLCRPKEADRQRVS